MISVSKYHHIIYFMSLLKVSLCINRPKQKLMCMDAHRGRRSKHSPTPWKNRNIFLAIWGGGLMLLFSMWVRLCYVFLLMRGFSNHLTNSSSLKKNRNSIKYVHINPPPPQTFIFIFFFIYLSILALHFKKKSFGVGGGGVKPPSQLIPSKTYQSSTVCTLLPYLILLDHFVSIFSLTIFL